MDYLYHFTEYAIRTTHNKSYFNLHKGPDHMK